MNEKNNKITKEVASSLKESARFSERDVMRPIKRRWHQPNRNETSATVLEREKQAIREAVYLANQVKAVYQLPDFQEMLTEKLATHLFGISNGIFEMLVCKHLGEAAKKAVVNRYIALSTLVRIVCYLNGLAKENRLHFPSWYKPVMLQGA